MMSVKLHTVTNTFVLFIVTLLLKLGAARGSMKW
jgi:hypothetical protein